jgi:hypothetical protein
VNSLRYIVSTDKRDDAALKSASKSHGPLERPTGKSSLILEVYTMGRSNEICNDHHLLRHHEDASKRLCDEAFSPATKAKHFHGLNLGIIKIGVDDRGSFALGVNVGIAHVDTRIGAVMGVDAGAGVGPVGAQGGVEVGIKKDGLHAKVRAGASASELAGGSLDFGASVGPKTGAEAAVEGNVGPAYTKHGASTYIGEDGFNTGYQGKVAVGDLAGVGARGHLGLNDNSSAGAEAGAHLGKASLGSGVDIKTDNNTMVRPEVNIIKAKVGNDETQLNVGAQVGPRADAQVGIGVDNIHTDDQGAHIDGNVLSAGVGESGINARATHKTDAGRDTRGYGFGPEPLDM